MMPSNRTRRKRRLTMGVYQIEYWWVRRKNVIGMIVVFNPVSKQTCINYLKRALENG